jgi:hypothetical protein
LGQNVGNQSGVKELSKFHVVLKITLKLRCDTRFQRVCVNQRNFFENAIACSKRSLKTRVVTQINRTLVKNTSSNKINI